MKEAANEKVIATEARDEECIKGNIDYIHHTPDHKLKHMPSNKLGEVAIENILQQQIVAE